MPTKAPGVYRVRAPRGEPDAIATLPELVCYNTLVELGYEPDADFTFQSDVLGGREEKGGQVVDFMFENPPGLAFSVLGEYYHYRLRGGSRLEDLTNRDELALTGIDLIFLDEEDLLAQPRWVVGEALQRRDHSKVARGD